MAERVLPFLARAHGRCPIVLLGDPGRAPVSRDELAEVAWYDVPVGKGLEDADRKRTAIFQPARILHPPSDERLNLGTSAWSPLRHV